MWVQDLGTRPEMSIKVGLKSHDMRIAGRIAGVRSREQSESIMEMANGKEDPSRNEHKSGMKIPRYANSGSDCGNAKQGAIREYHGDGIWERGPVPK